MTPIRILLHRIAALAGLRSSDADLDEEVRAHLELLAADFERGGMTEQEARLAARRAFGGVQQMKEAYRSRRALPWVGDLSRDARYAFRTLARHPGVALTAVLTLALGIGANTALFTVMDGLLYKPLPVRNPGELRLFSTTGGRAAQDFSFSIPVYRHLQGGSTEFSGVAAFGGTGRMRLVAGSHAQAEVVRVQGISGNFFSVLGLAPAAGRLIAPADDRPNPAAVVAVLSDSFWSRRFGRDAAIVGQRVTVNDVPVTIAGVAEAGFSGVVIGEPVDLWWPIHAMPQLFGAPATALENRGFESWRILGRLLPGTNDARAEAQVAALFKTDQADWLGQSGPSMPATEREARAGQTLQLMPGAAGFTRLRTQFERPLFVLMIVVALVLLIACANVANLLLARAAARRREIAVRLALGAGRSRLARQLLTESVVLAGAGGLLGTVVALAGSRLVAAFMNGQDVTLPVGPDGRVLAFTAAASLASALLFGLAPSLAATRVAFNSSLREPLPEGVGRLTIQNAIVICQVALSVVVLVAAGLFLRTLVNLQGVSVGYDRADLTVFSIDVPRGYDAARRSALYDRIVERLEQQSGSAAGYSFFGFLTGNGLSDEVAAPGRDERVRAFGSLVSDGYFGASGTRILQGRGFERGDNGSPIRVAVVNESMARRIFGESAIGRQFTLPRIFPGETFEVIGVAADSTYRDLRAEALDAVSAFYLPVTQAPGASFAARATNIRIALRLPMGSIAAESMIRRTVRDVDPAVALAGILPMSAVIDAGMARERMLARLALWFGGLALALGAVGIYGVRSYAVSRRTNEIGIRMALGADARDVLALVIGQGLVMALLGVAIGLAAAAGVTRFIAGLLFRIEPLDPETFAAVAVLFACVAAAASYLPARRAARIDPAVTLRSE